MQVTVAFFYQRKDVTETENVLSMGFADVCKWFVNNKLSIYFGENKSKCILFSQEKKLPEPNITYDNNRIKKIHIVEFLGCYLEANLSGESMATKFLKEINTKVTVLM